MFLEFNKPLLCNERNLRPNSNFHLSNTVIVYQRPLITKVRSYFIFIGIICLLFHREKPKVVLVALRRWPRDRPMLSRTDTKTSRRLSFSVPVVYEVDTCTRDFLVGWHSYRFSCVYWTTDCRRRKPTVNTLKVFRRLSIEYGTVTFPSGAILIRYIKPERHKWGFIRTCLYRSTFRLSLLLPGDPLLYV